ncbi:hypothetical protein BHM03_00046945 [Ensete ventricosum]|nr:hypothetical protein BHM03_00046945 [Ensete ventricosum]
MHLCRVGRGIWRRGAESPEAVKWEDRIIEVREGPWSYVAGTVGVAPGKIVQRDLKYSLIFFFLFKYSPKRLFSVQRDLKILSYSLLIVDKIVGTATPKKEDSQVKKTLWCLSTGDVLTIQWESGLDIQLANGSSGEQVIGICSPHFIC